MCVSVSICWQFSSQWYDTFVSGSSVPFFFSVVLRFGISIWQQKISVVFFSASFKTNSKTLFAKYKCPQCKWCLYFLANLRRIFFASSWVFIWNIMFDRVYRSRHMFWEYLFWFDFCFLWTSVFSTKSKFLLVTRLLELIEIKKVFTDFVFSFVDDTQWTKRKITINFKLQILVCVCVCVCVCISGFIE